LDGLHDVGQAQVALRVRLDLLAELVVGARNLFEVFVDVAVLLLAVLLEVHYFLSEVVEFILKLV